MPNEEALKKAVGARLKAVREAMGMTQQQLADALGGYRSQVSQWEKGRIWCPWKHLSRMPEVLNCDMTDLMPGRDEGLRAAGLPAAPAAGLAGLAVLDGADLSEVIPDVRRMAVTRLESGDLLLVAPAWKVEDADSVLVSRGEARMVCRCDQMLPGDRLLGKVVYLCSRAS